MGEGDTDYLKQTADPDNPNLNIYLVSLSIVYPIPYIKPMTIILIHHIDNQGDHKTFHPDTTTPLPISSSDAATKDATTEDTTTK